jgi:poly-gamma-glutamate capsule biosynthesis protein CapA/YwtB (metallophosphatase superfamily)
LFNFLFLFYINSYKGFLLVFFMNRREFCKSVALSSLSLVGKRSFGQVDDYKIVISGAGDVTLGFRFGEMFDKIENSFGEEEAFRFPFLNVKEFFYGSDISIVNLEGTLTNYGRKRPKKFNFKGDPRFVKCLSDGGIEVVNLGNNHFMDFYEQGALDTLDTLDLEGINYCGGGRDEVDSSNPRFITSNDVVVGFLGYALVGRDFPAGKNSPGVNKYTSQKAKDEIKYAKDNSDLVVVSCHWGIEREPFPTREQREVAKLMVDSGADIVFGHHPHVIQGVEKYNSGLIFYSLGNFVFGGNSFPSDRDSMIARVTCSKQGVESFSIVPVMTHPQSMIFQPYVPEDTSRIREKIISRSRNLYAGEINFEA